MSEIVYSRKVLLIVIIVLLVGANIIPLTSGSIQKTTTSKKFITQGTILYVGGSGPNNFSKIQDAINHASTGDTIFVFDDSSPYYENIVINKSINLVGEKRQSTIIDGKNIGPVITLACSQVHISKFTIQNSSKGNSAGIRGSTNYSTLANNTIIANNWSGLVLLHSHHNTITRNTINSNQWSGIHCGTCNHNIISHNIIHSNNNEGMNLYETQNNTISNNLFSKNECGLYIGKYCENNTISGNSVLLNEYGIQLYETYENNMIKHNAIRWNMYGLFLEYAYNNLIEHNNFIRNGINACFNYYLPDGETKNYWNGNYWNRPRMLPKIVVGVRFTYSGFMWEPYFEFDKKPACFPNNIG